MKSGSVLLLILIAAILGVLVALRLRGAPEPVPPTTPPVAPDADAVAKAELASIEEYQAADPHFVHRDETLNRYAYFIERHRGTRWAETAEGLRDRFLARPPSPAPSPTGTPVAAAEDRE